MKSVQIIGTGRALPAKCVTSSDLDKKFELQIGHLETATGVKTRYICDSETQIDLAVNASRRALDDAEINANDIDMVISACAVPYQPIPSTAPLVMHSLGIADGNATALDVNSTCLSFLSALDFARLKIISGQAETVLIFSSEIASRALPWETEPDVAALFGDGAAAAVIKASNSHGGVMPNVMRTFPSAYEACQIGAGGTRFDFHTENEAFGKHATFQMDGSALFKITAKHFKQVVADVLAQAGWAKDEVGLIIPHQASPFALKHMARLLDFAPDKIVDISSEYGNQIAASIPLTLDFARKSGRIDAKQRVLMLGTSAGVSIGGTAIEAS